MYHTFREGEKVTSYVNYGAYLIRGFRLSLLIRFTQNKILTRDICTLRLRQQEEVDDILND